MTPAIRYRSLIFSKSHNSVYDSPRFYPGTNSHLLPNSSKQSDGIFEPTTVSNNLSGIATMLVVVAISCSLAARHCRPRRRAFGTVADR